MLQGLQALGYEVELVSSDLFTDQPWTESGIEAIRRSYGVNVQLHRGTPLDRQFVQQAAAAGRLWDLHVPPGLRGFFSEACRTLQPELVLINYAYWAGLAGGPGLEAPIRLIEMHDLVTLSRARAMAANRFLPQPPFTLRTTNPVFLQEDFFEKLNLAPAPGEFAQYAPFDGVIAISPTEAEMVRQHVPGANVHYLPVALPVRDLDNTYAGAPLLVISNNPFNIQGYLFFARDILPRLRREVPGLTVEVIGNVCQYLQPAPGMNFAGYVDDLARAYRAGRFALCPLLCGTGQQVKVAEAMAHGLPVVVMRHVAGSSPVQHQVNGLVANNAAEFAQAVLQLYRDPALCRRFGQAARQQMQARFSPEEFASRLQAAIETARQRRDERLKGTAQPAAIPQPQLSAAPKAASLNWRDLPGRAAQPESASVSPSASAKPAEAQPGTTPGVRPSPGAAATERAGALECLTAALAADMAAPGDGRTPFSPPAVGAISGCAPASEPAGPRGAKVLIDGVIFQLQQKAPAGIARVWTSLLTELGKSNLAKDILLLDRASTAPAIPGIQTRPAPAYDGLRFESDPLLLQEICQREQAGLFVSTYYTFPERTHSMIMLHDMIPEVTGQDLSLPEWRAKATAIQKASAYLCVSNSTMTDFRQLHPELTGRPVYLTPNAVGDEFHSAPLDEVAAFCSRFGIRRSYFLLVGRRALYKNAQLFCRAFASWERRAQFDIVCAGGAPELERSLQGLLHGLPCHVLALSDAELAAAYSGAAALVYPSRCEGFGLPILEAHKCGCPVITCRNSSLPEVAGQAALFVGENDVAGLQAALGRVLDDATRRRLIEQGLENTRRFSWARTAGALVEAVKAVRSQTAPLELRSADPLNTVERLAWGLAKNDQRATASGLLDYTRMALNRRPPDLAGMARLEQDLAPALAGLHRALASLPESNGDSDALLCFFHGLALEHRLELKPALRAYSKALTASTPSQAAEFRVRLGLRIARIALELGDPGVCEQVLLACVLPIDPQNAQAHELLKQTRGEKPAPPAEASAADPSPRSDTATEPAPSSFVIRHSSLAPPLVSALVSAYNSVRFMRGCLEDLERQTIADRLEIIVVNSASPQNERAVVQEFQKRYSNIVYIRTEERETVYGAWNRAIRAAHGKYLTNANTDDRHRPDAFEVLARALDQHPEVALVYADCLITRTENQTFETATVVRTYQWLDFNRADLVLKGCFVGPQPMWRREVHDEHGCFDPGFVSAGDYEFWLRIARTQQFLHVKETLGLYLESPASVEHASRDRADKETAEAKARHAAALLAPAPPNPSIHQSANPPIQPDRSATPAPRKPLVLPACALLGHLGPARELLRRRTLPEAWAAAHAAIQARPFHPEAWLLLAEIALAGGASIPARHCAQHALKLAPQWKPARKFLQGRLRGNAKPAWLVMPELVHSPQSTVHSPQSTVHSPQSTVHSPQSTVHSPQSTAHSPQPTVHSRLSVCLIAKNEEAFLPQCLASVRGLADQIVLVDTGSTDRTVEIAREHGAEIHSFAWCDDFSAARNAALEHVTGDWVLMLDADEELPPESHAPLRRLMQEKAVIAWRLPIIDVGREDEGCSYVPRLFRNGPALFFVGRVHEQIFSSLEVRRKEWGLDNRLGDAPLRHHGYRPEVVKDRDKIERNLRLLERAVEEMPGEPNLLMSYGLELARSGQRERGVAEYLKAFDRMSEQPASAAVPELREMLLSQLSTQLIALKRWSELVCRLRSPLAQAGGLTASLHFALGLAHLELKQFSEAADQMRQCLDKRHLPSLAPINKEIRKAGPRHCLALCLDQLGQADAAAEQFRAALQDDPKSRPARLDYAAFLAAHGQPAEALNLLFALAGESPEDAQAWLRGGSIALSAPEFQEVALDWTSSAHLRLPRDPAVAQQRAQALTQAGQCEAALPLWRSLER